MYGLNYFSTYYKSYREIGIYGHAPMQFPHLRVREKRNQIPGLIL